MGIGSGGPTILFAWELGANLGHAFPLAAIARRLRQDVQVVVAARDLAYARMAFADTNATLVQAPVWPRHRHLGNEDGQAGYLDLLVHVGFADPVKLDAMVAGWDSLLELIKPDVIVCDHSPGLMAACFGKDVPVITIGSAFTTPPLDYGRFPPLFGDRSPLLPEERVLQSVTEVLAERRIEGPKQLVDLFRGTHRIATGLPELDPYRSFRRELLHLPPEPLPGFVDPPAEPHLFVYLGSELPHLETVVQALAEMRFKVSAYLRGEVGALPGFLKLRGHEVFDRPPLLAEILPKVSHVISSGGAFTSHAAITAGRPHLVAALQDESRMTLGQLRHLYIGQGFTPGHDSSAMQEMIAAFVVNHGLLRAARSVAAVVAARPQPSSAEALAAALGRHLRGRPGAPIAVVPGSRQPPLARS